MKYALRAARHAERAGSAATLDTRCVCGVAPSIATPYAPLSTPIAQHRYHQDQALHDARREIERALRYAVRVKLAGIPFQSIDWSRIAATSHPGAPGVATWRTLEVGNVRVRKVEYSAGYVADHWCERGHVVLVVDGELVTELSDGRRTTLGAGDSYVVADRDGAHRSSSPAGAHLFIVD